MAREFMDEEVDERELPLVCRFLRTKTAFGSLAGAPHRWQEGVSSTAVYWCLKTMEGSGPDDALAHPHRCCSGRTCFKDPDAE